MVGAAAYYILALLKLTGVLERPAALPTEVWILGIILLAWAISKNDGGGPRSPALVKQVAELIAFPLREERKAA
jgi:threonine/homoserine/homoserine lactone efflux protein